MWASKIAVALVLVFALHAQAVHLDATAINDLCKSSLGPLAGQGNEPLSACQWHNKMVNADLAYLAGATGKGVRVGILDTGIDLTHPDLLPNIDLASSCSFIYGNTAGAGNGDCSNKAAVQDFHGHGTHVASIVAAAANSIGIQGVAPKATIVAIKVCAGGCPVRSIVEGLRYAADVVPKLDVINLSFGATAFRCLNNETERDVVRAYHDAVQYAMRRGVVVVTSAGNNRIDLGHPENDTNDPSMSRDDKHNNCVFTMTEIPGIISVAALGPVTLAGYSTVGLPVNIAAPGGDPRQLPALNATAPSRFFGSILAAWTSTDTTTTFTSANAAHRAFDSAGGRYLWTVGTSMAAPVVTGVAALIKERHPEWNNGAVAAALCRTATPRACPTDWPANATLQCVGSATSNSFFGCGVVDARAAAAL